MQGKKVVSFTVAPVMKQSIISGTNMFVFWVAAASSQVEVYRRFSGVCCLNHQRFSDYRQNKYLRNADKLLPDY
jgi:hypothetical protein